MSKIHQTLVSFIMITKAGYVTVLCQTLISFIRIHSVFEISVIFLALHASTCSVPETKCCVCSIYRKHTGKRYWGHALNYHPTGLTPRASSPRDLQKLRPKRLSLNTPMVCPEGIRRQDGSPSPKNCGELLSPSRLSPRGPCLGRHYPLNGFIQVNCILC